MADNASLSIIIQILWLAYCVHVLCLDDHAVCYYVLLYEVLCIIVLDPIPLPPTPPLSIHAKNF